MEGPTRSTIGSHKGLIADGQGQKVGQSTSAGRGSVAGGAHSAGQGQQQVGNGWPGWAETLESPADTEDHLAKSECGPGGLEAGVCNRRGEVRL